VGDTRPNGAGRPSPSASRDRVPAQDPAAAGGTAGTRGVERRLVSVLFADLVGSTSMAEGADMELVREMLGSYYELCRDVVRRYGGVVEKFIGDAVMAVWGTPVAHEDDAERAVRAALDLVDGARSLRTPAGDALVVRAGVLTGEAAATLGAEGQALVAGDLVNTAARMQSAAAPGTVLVGEATMRASEASIDYEPAGDQPFKGKAAPVPAWRAVRVAAGHGGTGRAARLEPPFVGRDDELRMVKEVFLQAVRERRPRLVSITGTAGIGKSRLAWELEKYIDGMVETVYWHQGRSPAYGDGLAFWALGEMVRQRARVAETDDPSTARDKLAVMAAEYLLDPEERARVEPRLAALLGLEAAPAGGAEELAAAWRTLFERIADHGPTVLVFEDLHWAESGLLDFIEGLLGAGRSRPILVLALTRPELMETRPTWGATVRNHLRLDLAPLDDAAMEMLLLGMAPGIPPEAITRIRARAEGIPLYAVETVRMLLDSGALTESEGRFRLIGELGDLAVPDSLTALLGARLDALDPDTRDVVGTCSILGISFTAASVAAVGGRSAAGVRAVLDGLVRRELFAYDDDPLSPERGQHRFLQGVLREVAYGRLSRKERQARHLAAAEVLGAEGGDELAGVVATHYVEAVRFASDDDREALQAQATAALEGAAARSRAIGAYASAARYLGEAADLAAGEGERLRLRDARLTDLARSGDTAATLAEAADLLEIGRGIGDRGLQARAAFRMADALLNRGRPPEAVAVLTEVRAELGGFVTEDPDGVRLLAELGRCHLMAAQTDDAAVIIDQALIVAERLNLRDVVAELLASKGWALGSSGRALEATALLRGAVVFAERGGYHRAEFRARMNFSAWGAGEDGAEAYACARTGLERAQMLGYDAWIFPLLGNAASAALEFGDWAWLRQATTEARVEEQDAAWALQALAPLALAFGFMGDDVAARRIEGQMSEAAEGLEDLQIRSGVASVRAKIALARGDLEETGRQTDLEAEDEATLHLYDTTWHVIVGLERREPERLRLALSDQLGGRANLAIAEIATAGVAVLGGDLSALPAMDAAIAGLEATGFRLSAAVLRRSRVQLSPDDEGAPQAAALAAAFFRTVGAVTMLPRLEPLLAGAGGTDAVPASTGERATAG
jgi:class 3 adenylate cyclase